MEIQSTTDTTLIARLNEPVQNLHAKLYPEYFKPYDFDEIRKWFERVVEEDQESTFLVIRDEEQIAGYAWIQVFTRKENPFKKESKALKVHQFSIMPAERKKGCGTHLMNYICQSARDKGINEIVLDYWSDNEGAERFYQKHQFTVYQKAAHKLL